MRILCGTDIVLVSRVRKSIALKDDGSLPAFVTKCYTPDEIEYCMKPSNEDKRVERFAARFAAKEAVSKALGTGIMTMGIGFLDIEVKADELGAPYAQLKGEAKKRADELGIVSVAISLSHDGDYAICYCTALAEGKEDTK